MLCIAIQIINKNKYMRLWLYKPASAVFVTVPICRSRV